MLIKRIVDTNTHLEYYYTEVMTVERKGSGGRPRFGTPRTTRCERINVTLPDDMIDRLNRFCTEEERAKSWVINKALELYFQSKGYE